MNHFEWDFSPPSSPPMGDHDVECDSHHLRSRRIALLVCGGIAAMKAPMVARALRRRGADVVAFASGEALRYVGREALEWSTVHPVITELSWRAEHLSDSAPFDAYLVAPATYNTIAKVAAGIADTVVTSALASALGRMHEGRTQILMAPTMHGSMHHPLWVSRAKELRTMGVRFVTPRDAYGKHNLPDDAVVVAAVTRALSQSPLRDRQVILRCVTGDVPPATALPRPLGSWLAEHLVLEGAELTCFANDTRLLPPAWISCILHKNALRETPLGVVPEYSITSLTARPDATDAQLAEAIAELLGTCDAAIAERASSEAGTPRDAWLATRAGIERFSSREDLVRCLTEYAGRSLPTP